MHIKAARPFSRFAAVPVWALFDGERLGLGKGELFTLARIAAYLQGKQMPLEGSTADWCAALGVDERSFQNHVPLLGSTGCLLYARPQRGWYVMQEIVYDAAQAQSIRDEAKKFSPGVVVDLPLVELDLKSDQETPKKKQQQNEPKKFSLPDEFLARLDQIGWTGATTEIATAFAADAARVWGWLRFWEDPENCRSVRNVAAMFRIALRGETWPPERYMTIEANDDDRAGDVEAEPTDEQLRVQKAQAIWSKIAQCLRLQMTKATYDMHFGQAVCSGFNSSDQVLVVSVVSQYAREWIEARLMRVVDRAISEAGYDGMQIHWTVGGDC